MARDYSDLEVVPGQEDRREEKIVYGFSAIEKKGGKRICKLPVRIFWLIAGTVLVIIAGGAVGAGLGITLSQRNRDGDPAAAAHQNQTTSTTVGPTPAPESASSNLPSSSKTPTTATTTSTPVALTTTTIPLPTGGGTVWSDCPSSNNTVYNALSSGNYQFRKVCGSSYRGSRINLVDEPSASLDDCINLCVAWNVKNKAGIDGGVRNVCNSVCWRNDQSMLGHCYGSTYQNSSMGFAYNYEQ